MRARSYSHVECTGDWGSKTQRKVPEKGKKNQGDENWKTTGVISFENIEVLFCNKGEKEKDVLDVGNYCQYVRDAEAFWKP